MPPNDELPQRPKAHDTAEAAVTAFRTAVAQCSFFLVQREDRNDYGADVQIEARHGTAITNVRVHVQLKGTNRTANANGSVSISVDRTNLTYLLAQADSLYVCYHLPSKRLLVRDAEDVYREYEHRGGTWYDQDTITVKLTQPFDETFQCRLNERLLASGSTATARRLLLAVTPPERLVPLVEREAPIIDVPADSVRASKVLAELYRAGQDRAISRAFDQFAAVLDSSLVMDLAYMAEINLGVNGFPFNQERVREAIPLLEHGIQRGDSHTASLLYCIGNAHLALQQNEDARNSYEAALQQTDSPELRGIAARCNVNLGSALGRLGQAEDARKCYERALTSDPELPEAHFALALLHRRRGEDALALQHLDHVFPCGDSALHMPVVLGWRIDLLFRVGDSEGAFRAITSLLEDARRITWVWPWCAKQVAQYGKSSADIARKAVSFWRVFLREHPEHPTAKCEEVLCLWHMHAGGLSSDVGFDGFKRMVVQLIGAGDQSPAFLWDRLGHWAQHDNDWQGAEEAYRKAWELEPASYGYCLGTALNFLGRHQAALPLLLAQAEEHQPDAKSWFQVAVAREGVGDLNGCISAYQLALQLDPDYDLAWFNLGGIYWNSRDVARATETWRQAVARFPNHELAGKLRREYPLLFSS